MALIKRLKRVENPFARTSLLYGRGALHYLRRGHLMRRQAVQHYLDSTTEPALQIGGGPIRIDGWLNSDLISGDLYLDLNRRLPLPDASFQYAFGEHVIEHISEPRAEQLLGELHRILRPGGVLRLTTPDLCKLIAIYEDRNPVITREHYAAYLDELTGKRHDRGSQIVNDYMRLWGHRFIYDEDGLAAKLRAAGFERIERREPKQSPHERLRDLERHGGADWVNEAEAMCLEATRPAAGG